MATHFQFSDGKLRLQLYVQPKSSKTAWAGVIERDSSIWIKLKVSSPPVDGAANKEIQKFLSKEFKATKSEVRIVQGEKNRLKIVELTGVDESRVQTFLKLIKPAT